MITCPNCGSIDIFVSSITDNSYCMECGYREKTNNNNFKGWKE